MQDSSNWINPNIEQEEETSLIEIVFHYIKFWKFFVISITSCLILALIFLQYSIPQYKVASSAIIKDGKQGLSGVEITAFNDLGIISQSGNFFNEIAKRVINCQYIIVHALALPIKRDAAG